MNEEQVLQDIEKELGGSGVYERLVKMLLKRRRGNDGDDNTGGYGSDSDEEDDGNKYNHHQRIIPWLTPQADNYKVQEGGFQNGAQPGVQSGAQSHVQPEVEHGSQHEVRAIPYTPSMTSIPSISQLHSILLTPRKETDTHRTNNNNHFDINDDNVNGSANDINSINNENNASTITSQDCFDPILRFSSDLGFFGYPDGPTGDVMNNSVINNINSLGGSNDTQDTNGIDEINDIEGINNMEDINNVNVSHDLDLLCQAIGTSPGQQTVSATVAQPVPRSVIRSSADCHSFNTLNSSSFSSHFDHETSFDSSFDQGASFNTMNTSFNTVNTNSNTSFSTSFDTINTSFNTIDPSFDSNLGLSSDISLNPRVAPDFNNFFSLDTLGLGIRYESASEQADQGDIQSIRQKSSLKRDQDDYHFIKQEEQTDSDGNDSDNNGEEDEPSPSYYQSLMALEMQRYLQDVDTIVKPLDQFSHSHPTPDTASNCPSSTLHSLAKLTSCSPSANKDLSWSFAYARKASSFLSSLPPRFPCHPSPHLHHPLSKHDRNQVLNSHYEKSRKLTKLQTKQVAYETGMSEKSVRIWFCNRRSREKGKGEEKVEKICK